VKAGKYLFIGAVVFAALVMVAVPNLLLQIASFFRTFGDGGDKWKSRRKLAASAIEATLDPDKPQPGTVTVAKA